MPRPLRLLLSLVALLPSVLSAQTAPSTAPAAFKSMKDSLRPAPKGGGFAMKDYFIWCSSVIKVGDTYHMFASRWPAEYGMGGWTKYSECVRATSKELLGPYKFEEVVLQKREGKWDNDRVHNVKIVKAGEKFVLYYISSANETGYAESDSITGPWKRCDEVAMNFSNPAPLVRGDGSVYVFGRKKTNGIDIALAFTAPTYKGPYTLIGDEKTNLLPKADYELEDPTIWWASDQYNVLLNDFGGHATGTPKAGAQYFSKDGKKWEIVTTEPVFTKTVPFDDGLSETFSRRERPFVYQDEGGSIVALFTACLPKDGPARVVVQPVDHYVPAGK